MFGRYNTNDLFFACINITHPDVDYDPETGLLESRVVSYNYFTILLKKDHHYIDLQNRETFSNRMASYEFNFLEPLSNYYTLTGKKKHTLNKKEAIEVSKVLQKHIKQKS